MFDMPIDKMKTQDFPINMTSQESCYLDMGELSGAVTSNMMVWWPEPVHIDENKLSQYLDQLFSQLSKAGIKEIEMAFAQIGDLDALVNDGQGEVSKNDIIATILSTKYPVGDTKANLIQYFITKAHSSDLKVDLSFGGANAANEDLQICLEGETADGQANKLVTFLTSYDFDSIDFDLEGSGSSALLKYNTAEQIDLFFTTLQTEMSKVSKSVTLTVEGSIQDGPKGTLSVLFENDKFNTYFNGLNLMLYSDTKYYIDADNVTWGIDQWLDIIGKENAYKIHIGFDDGIAYEDPSASAGKIYSITPGADRGKAAAEVYTEFLADLKSNGYPNSLGSPFWWPANTVHAPDNWSRYNPTIKGDVVLEDFDTEAAMQSFYDNLPENR